MSLILVFYFIVLVLSIYLRGINSYPVYKTLAL